MKGAEAYAALPEYWRKEKPSRPGIDPVQGPALLSSLRIGKPAVLLDEAQARAVADELARSGEATSAIASGTSIVVGNAPEPDYEALNS